jgi:hypothetical protein
VSKRNFPTDLAAVDMTIVAPLAQRRQSYEWTNRRITSTIRSLCCVSALGIGGVRLHLESASLTLSESFAFFKQRQ